MLYVRGYLVKLTLIFLSFFFLQACTSQMQSVFDEGKSSINLSLETKSSGEGVKYDDQINLDIEDTLTIYSILRDSNGEFLENVEVSWALGEGVGELLILNQGKSATFSSDSLGTNTIKVFKDNVLVKTYTLNVKVLVPRTLTVEDVYPLNGDWNDYVKNDEPSKDWYSQDNVTCAGTEVGKHSNCIHGGEKKKVEITVEPSCENLSIKDGLQAFNWICDDSLGHVVFMTSGLKESKGLKDLVTETEWKDNDVVVLENGKAKHRSVLSKWWTNDVIALPDNSGTNTATSLTTAGAVYTLASTRSSSGYSFGADRISVTTLGDSILLFDNVNTGTTLLATNSHSFVWVEGNYSMYPSVDTSNKTLSVYLGQFHTIRNANVFGYVYARGLDTSRFIRVSIVGSPTTGLYTMYSNNGPVFYDVMISNSAGTGFAAHRNGGYMVKVVVANGNGQGVSGGGDATFHHLTAVNNSTIGYQMWASTNITVSQALMRNNGGSRSIGIYDASQNLKFSQLAMDEIYIGGSSTDISFHNSLILSKCDSESSGLNPGLTETADSCVNQGSSDAIIQNFADLSNTIVAKVFDDDTKNQTDLSGVATHTNDPQSFDWFNFDSRFRTWGADGSTFPSGDNKGKCDGGSTCRIWDFRIPASNTLILNNSNSVTFGNEDFLAGLACPSAVDGNNVITNTSTEVPTSTYLVNATEVMEDSIGNENGLCESNEACIYSPNIGAYQGEGDFRSNGTCAFQDGAVSGVTMYAYPNNGI